MVVVSVLDCQMRRPGYAPTLAESLNVTLPLPLVDNEPPWKYRRMFVPETSPPVICRPLQKMNVPPVANETVPPVILRRLGYTPAGYTPPTGDGLAPVHAAGTPAGSGSPVNGSPSAGLYESNGGQ